MSNPSAYLDTCVLSHLFDLGGAAPPPARLVALERIADCPTIDLVTSEKTLEEISKDQDQTRRVSNKLLYKLLTKVNQNPIEHFLPSTFGGLAFGVGTFGGGATVADPLVVELGKIFPDRPDVEHIFQAVKNGCTYFVTIDRKSILNKVKVNATIVAGLCPGLSFLLPEELAPQL
jgi:hypothetical protein